MDQIKNSVNYFTLTEHDDNVDVGHLFAVANNLAVKMLDNKDVYNIKGDPTLEELTSLIVNIEIEQLRLSSLSDKLLEFGDEIVEIECLEEEVDMLDIKVSGSSLFYANNILTKNSSGPSMSADTFWGIIRTPELDELNQVMFKQLKNRYGSLDYYRKFVVGIDRSRMKLYNVDSSEQAGISQDVDSKPNQKHIPSAADKSTNRYSKQSTKSVQSDDWDFE